MICHEKKTINKVEFKISKGNVFLLSTKYYLKILLIEIWLIDSFPFSLYNNKMFLWKKKLIIRWSNVQNFDKKKLSDYYHSIYLLKFRWKIKENLPKNKTKKIERCFHENSTI